MHRNTIENLTNVEKKGLKLGLSVTKSDKNGYSSNKFNWEIISPIIDVSNHSINTQKRPPNNKKKSLFSATRDRWQHSIAQENTVNQNKSPRRVWKQCVMNVKSSKLVGMKISPKKSPPSTKKIVRKRADNSFPNAKIFPKLKQVDIKSSLSAKTDSAKDDQYRNLDPKVRQLVKNYENNFVDKTPVKPEHSKVIIERNLENKNCGFKNAFEAIMKSGGGDTPNKKTPRKSGRSGIKKLKRLDKDRNSLSDNRIG